MPMLALERLTLVLLTALLAGCGGGSGGSSSAGAGGGTNTPPTPPPTAPPTLNDRLSGAEPIDPQSLVYSQKFYPSAQVNLAVPTTWRAQSSSEDSVLEFFLPEEPTADASYIPNLAVIRTTLNTEPTGVPRLTSRLIFRDTYEIDGLTATEEIIDTALPERPDLELRVITVWFQLGNDGVAVSFAAEVARFPLYRDVIRYIARSLVAGATALPVLDQSRDPKVPGRIAIATNPGGALQVACKETGSGSAELVGTYVTAERITIDLPEPLARVKTALPGCRLVSPDLAAAGDDFLLVYAAVDDGSKIFGQRINRFGEARQAPFLISEQPSRAQQPRVLFDGSRYLVVWTQTLNAEDRIALLGRFVDVDAGADEPFEIDADLGADYDAGNGVFTPQIAIGSGLIAVTWAPYWFRTPPPVPPIGVWVRLLDFSGRPVSERIALREPTNLSPRHLQIAGAADGFTVAWIEGELTQPGNALRGTFGAYAKQVSNAGQVLGGEPTVPGIELVAPAPADSRALEFLHLRAHPNGYRLSWLQSRVIDDAGVYSMLLGPDAQPLAPAQVIRGTFGQNRERGGYAFPTFPASYSLGQQEFISFPTELGLLEIWRIPPHVPEQ